MNTEWFLTGHNHTINIKHTMLNKWKKLCHSETHQFSRQKKSTSTGKASPWQDANLAKSVLWLHLDQSRLSCLSPKLRLWESTWSTMKTREESQESLNKNWFKSMPKYVYLWYYTYMYTKNPAFILYLIYSYHFLSAHLFFIHWSLFLWFSDAVGEGDAALVFDACGWRSGCCNSCG